MSLEAAIPAKRILVIDDNPINLKITAALTRKAGLLVDTVETAEGALERLHGSRPDLIVTDLHLTGMDGLELTRAVKTNPAWASIPVILLTADSSKELEASAQQAGCACLINKPVNPRLFPGVIAAFLGSPSPSLTPSLLDDLPLEALRKEFLDLSAAECRTLLADFTASRLFVPAVDWISIRRALHRWAGVGGTLGFPAITRQARELEVLTETSDPSKRDDLREHLMELLQQFLHSVPVEQPSLAPRKEIRVFDEVAEIVKPVVLVVDDDPTIRAVLRFSLLAAGCECRLADNGALGCTMARNDPPDAIVLDVDMPRMDGFQVLYALRNQWSTRKIPVILLTARREEADVVQAAQLGALDYITKPFDINSLLARLDTVLEPSPRKAPERMQGGIRA